PEIDPQPGKAAIRNIQGQGEATGGMEGTVGASGEGAMPGGAVEEGRTHGEEGAAADVPADETVFLVVVASGKLGVEAADRLIRHLDTYNLGSPAHLRRSGRGGGQLMIYLGPFPTRDAAKAVLGRVRRLPEYRRTRFSDAYVYSLRAPELQDASDGARP
ncbi:MAG: SPOR domain-containing protein, partial [Planctomycetota bacterium]